MDNAISRLLKNSPRDEHLYCSLSSCTAFAVSNHAFLALLCETLHSLLTFLACAFSATKEPAGFVFALCIGLLDCFEIDSLLLSLGFHPSHELRIVRSAAAGSWHSWGFAEIAPGCAAAASAKLLVFIQLSRRVEYVRHLVATLFDADNGFAFRTALPSKSICQLDNLFQTNVCGTTILVSSELALHTGDLTAFRAGCFIDTNIGGRDESRTLIVGAVGSIR